MKKIFLFFFLIIGILCVAQNRIKFDYDVAGNQTSRVICINCTTAKSSSLYKNQEILEEKDLISDSENVNISYYPNPVSEELYLKWKKKEVELSQVILYNLNGQLIKVFDNLQKVETISISFQSLPEGYYNLSLLYMDGKNKSLKIIKNKN